MSLAEQCAAIRLLLSDVDGVLSNGLLSFDNHGNESKQFHCRDGMGIKLWQENGLKFGILTARESAIVTQRGKDLELEIVYQGRRDKLAAVREIAASEGLQLDEICFIGDDLLDLSAIQSVGLGVAVADAVEEVRQAATYITSQPGGCGAVRELVELILRNTNRWEATVQKYSATP
jgi:YrbI family 3-deoxy-D-manno-octulosonate 8-phosphate phosphatase